MYRILKRKFWWLKALQGTFPILKEVIFPAGEVHPVTKRRLIPVL
jgi:hypothetical protein